MIQSKKTAISINRNKAILFWDLNFGQEAGNLVRLLGENDTGKSTLLRRFFRAVTF